MSMYKQAWIESSSSGDISVVLTGETGPDEKRFRFRWSAKMVNVPNFVSCTHESTPFDVLVMTDKHWWHVVIDWKEDENDDYEAPPDNSEPLPGCDTIGVQTPEAFETELQRCLPDLVYMLLFGMVSAYPSAV